MKIIKRIEQELKRLGGKKLGRELHVRVDQKPGKISIKGKKLTDFTNWDFLNLNHDKRVVGAFQKEAEAVGVGAMASRVSSGTLPAHFSLEKRIADFLLVEKALLLPSLNQVSLSLVSALLSEGDCIIVDERLNGRVVDAALLVHAEVITFESSDIDSLERAIQQSQPYNNKVIFCDSVNSITGEILDLNSVIELTNKYQMPFILDESFALGVLGLRGAGLLDGLTAPKTLLCRIGSLAYGLGVYGAFLAGPGIIIEYIINRSKTFLTEVSLPPALASALEAGINIIELDSAKRELLVRLGDKLTGLLKTAAIPVCGEGPVISMKFNTRQEADEVAEGLFHKGFFVEAISPGYLLDKGAVVRIIVNAGHNEADIERLFLAIEEIVRRSL